MKKIHLRGIIEAVLIVLVLAVAVYMRTSAPQMQTQTDKDTVSTSPASAWKTFQSSKLGFEVSIPENTNVDIAENNGGPQYIQFSYYGDVRLYMIIHTTDMPNLPSATALAQYRYMDMGIDMTVEIPKDSDIVMPGQSNPAMLFKVPASGGGEEKFPASVAIVMGRDHTFYEIDFLGDTVLSDTETKILNSFKFIPTNSTEASNATYDAKLLAAGGSVLAALRDNDYKALENITSPAGLSFNEEPSLDFSHIDVPQNKVSEIPSDTKKILFGYTDGKGDPIELTTIDYIKRWIYDRDYMHADKIGVNQILEGAGNVTNTLANDSHNRAFVAYRSTGKNGGFDWGTIYLFFDYVNGEYKLRGIAKNHWFI